jgi:hypothetical protein
MVQKEVKVTDWSEKLYQWREYAEVLYPLRYEVSDIFKTKCFYDDKWEYQERFYEADDDTVFLLKLLERLNEICDFVKSHISVLERRVGVEEEMRFNVEQAFEAWRRGLCPLLMKSVPRYVKADSMNWWETYGEIASFLTGENISYSDTQSAINAWKASHDVLKSA